MKTRKQVFVQIMSSFALVLVGCGSPDAITDLGGSAASSATTVVTVTEVIPGDVNTSASAVDPSPQIDATGADLQPTNNVSEQTDYSGNRPAKSRYENMLLPPGAAPANETARIGPWSGGKYQSLYTGNSHTSAAFANEIHATWLSYADPNGVNDPITFKAWSSATNRNYMVTCNEGPKYVTCTGGANAVVYIV